ncbi:helix-hairpin-helix domain-containing protein [Chitinibacter fontanus]|uniref:Helix-hairpin-helix domain-containing protein n=1 Tax=Chitinibacter fontanus TaxID=1737446 RepID=A0A7D5ZHQ6_9NEIS|nr:helix-hairpin-helix domain-containing protein [Chitinibacter fontanus]QLI82067.1 helix-hairpin-helix domain-containing protein [Chitinibacter fontanus]
MLKKLLMTLFASLALAASAFAAVNINTATATELEALKGIGPEKAKDIVEYRTKNGAFKTPEDIMKVPGIKEGTFAKIKADVTVTGKTSAAVPAAAPKASAKPADAKTAATAKPDAKATKAVAASAPAKK